MTKMKHSVRRRWMLRRQRSGLFDGACLSHPANPVRRSVRVIHYLCLKRPQAVDAPWNGLPAEGQRTCSALILPNPATGGYRTTLPSERYIHAQKTVINEQPLGIYERFSKNLRIPTNHTFACLLV